MRIEEDSYRMTKPHSYNDEDDGDSGGGAVGGESRNMKKYINKLQWIPAISIHSCYLAWNHIQNGMEVQH